MSSPSIVVTDSGKAFSFASALRSISENLLVGPPCRHYALAEVDEVRFRRRDNWMKVSSILWYQSAGRTAFTLPFPSTFRTARESPRAARRHATLQRDCQLGR